MSAGVARSQFESCLNSNYHPTPYGFQYRTAKAKDSIALHAWSEITKWQGEAPDSIGRKCVAELGYLSSAITGIVESSFRLLGAYIIGNRVSEWITQGVNWLKEESMPKGATIEDYHRVKKIANNSFDKTLQGVAQNVTSLGTNLVSHDCNVSVAKDVHEPLAGGGSTFLRILQIINPVTLVYAIVKNDPSGIMRNLNDYQMK